MTEPYTHSEMPPVIRRTDTDEYVLEGQSGLVVHTYTQTEMNHPDGWWSELVTAMESGYDDLANAIHDLTLLTVRRDWEYIDDR